MKTIEQYFREKLPKDVADKAIANCKGDNNSANTKDVLSTGLIGAFIWAETPEGHAYWQCIEQKYNA